jgi:hypothetical protein
MRQAENIRQQTFLRLSRKQPIKYFLVTLQRLQSNVAFLIHRNGFA